MFNIQAEARKKINRLKKTFIYWKLSRNCRKFKFSSATKIHNAKITLKILNDRLENKIDCVYLRFGDGEIYLLNCINDSHHNSSFTLKEELNECFSMEGEDVVKSVALHSKIFGHDEHMSKGVHLRSDREVEFLLKGCFQYFIGSQIYSPVAIHYLIVYEPELAMVFFKNLKIHKPIFVGNENNDPQIVEKLFGSKGFIATPPRDTYSIVDQLEDSILRQLDERNKEYDVVVFSCGVTAKILSKRLHAKRNGLFLFDLGSVIDLFHGRDKWTWVRLSGKNRAYWDEFLLRVCENKNG